MNAVCKHCGGAPVQAILEIRVNNSKQPLPLCASCFKKINKSIPPKPIGTMEELMDFLFRSAKDEGFPSYDEHSTPRSEKGDKSTKVREKKQVQEGILEQEGRNVTSDAAEGRIDPVIGRSKEIDQALEVLNRRNKNNPLFVGEAGVGKTAIAEGIAQRIAEGNVPEKLLNKEIISLSISNLVAGTSFRGQFEQKLKQLVAELKERDNVILFLDEIHQIVGAGSSEGATDAANILKPELARGDIKIMGATTIAEYRKYIEKDEALQRRFLPIMVEEPSAEDTIEMIKGVKDRYENYHNIILSDEVIEECVHLSKQYIHDRHLPDKAFDLIDMAGAKLNLQMSEDPQKEKKEALAQLVARKEECIQQQKFERAADYRDQELKLRKTIEMAESSGEYQEAKRVTKEEIQKLVERQTGIPVRKLQEQGKERNILQNLHQSLSSEIIGQDHAVKSVSNAIRRSRAGLRKNKQPIASFLFIGPTGVGKTELSKALAKHLFGSEEALIRIDMSEYMEPHSVSKLIGSPPGYVGYTEQGQLTEKIRRSPYCIILLDEFEKAHPDVRNIWLQVLADGQLTDSHGRKVSFDNTVIIATSNAGEDARHKHTLGFDSGDATQQLTAIETLKDSFPPELLNRWSSIIQFNRLTIEDVKTIAGLLMDELQETLAGQSITIKVTDHAKERLAEMGYSPEFGVRPLRRVIEEYVETGISDILIDDPETSHLLVETNQQNEIVVSKR
ncbi:ATP-dependent Clp protease ATP-binding subunit (plasmid) [Pontibacillus sp. ALD_SL1]|uniref:ATP-dependent Clp protease ATP-binding subunit n=1 Tax=Pontibacillus sp. ALD_SL1 TaxID=2777185 RepID=UPI001A9662DB|nr:ATP-dependent Clp protease ATP-binding subunit [Pontibacillus sp. ALD_SL1]QST02072.1 ATP-dependent Clp protease ATP-binding subunit [Pontibacillus sp. ALD_SL1]